MWPEQYTCIPRYICMECFTIHMPVQRECIHTICTHEYYIAENVYIYMCVYMCILPNIYGAGGIPFIKYQSQPTYTYIHAYTAEKIPSLFTHTHTLGFK